MHGSLHIFFLLSGVAADFNEGLVLLQTRATIVESEIGDSLPSNVGVMGSSDEMKTFGQRVRDMQSDMAAEKRLYRLHKPVGLTNGDIKVQADAPAFRRQTRARPNIFFVHNNKCGGSEICYMAQVNGERSPVGPTSWGCEPPHKSWEEIDEDRINMATYVETQGISPKELLDLKAANDTILMTIVRDPVTRLVSEWRHYGFRWDPTRDDGTDRAGWTDLDTCRDDMDAMLAYHSTRDPDKLTWNVGGSNITEAIQALHQYDLVLITEDLDSTDLARLKTLGWTSQDRGRENHHNAGDPTVLATIAGNAAASAAIDNGSTLQGAQEAFAEAVKAAGVSPFSDSASVYKYLGPERVQRINELFASDVALYKAAVDIAREQRRVQVS